MSTKKELLEKRGKLEKELDTLGELVKTEKRAFTTDENTKFEALYAEVSELNRSIANFTKIEEREAAQRETAEREARERGTTPDALKEQREKERVIFRKYMRSGMAEMSSDEQAILMQKRAQTVGTGSSGGYLIPEGFSYEVDIALKAYGGVREVARIMPTDMGNDIPFPNLNDTANAGRLLAENTAATETDLVFGTTTLKAYKFSSDSILVPYELLQDSGINVEALIAEMFVTRLGRLTNGYYTTGTGTAQPMGVVTAAATTGVTNAAAAAISFDDMINLYHGLDPAYRNKGTFMFNDSTLKALVKLSIGTDFDMPLWQPSYRDGSPATILGKPYVINQDMASIGASAKSVLFGDFSKYIIRSVNGRWFLRVEDKYKESFQVGFVMGQRESGHYVGVSGAQAAIKVLQHAAS